MSRDSKMPRAAGAADGLSPEGPGPSPPASGPARKESAFQETILGGDLVPARDVCLWRYMSLGKFTSLLKRRQLFFPRLGALKDVDPFEGSLPQSNFDRMGKAASLEAARVIDPEAQRLARAYLSENDSILQLLDLCNRMYYVLCWHDNEHESAAMWRLYLPGGEGIAIRTTVAKLEAALGDAASSMSIGRAYYYDPAKDLIPPNPVIVSLAKRISFEHEREVRVVAADPTAPLATGRGIYVPCDICELIEAVHVAPTLPDFFLEAVQGLVDAFQFDIKVHRSSLDNPPGQPVVV